MSNTQPIETAFDFLFNLNESLDSFRNISENNNNSTEAYSGMFSLAGIVFQILSDESDPFVQSLSSAIGKKASAIGLVLSAMELKSAIDDYSRSTNNPDSTVQEAAFKNLADKTLGLIAGLGATVATFPGGQLIGISTWFLATITQKMVNGDLDEYVITLGDFFDWSLENASWLGFNILDKLISSADAADLANDWNTAKQTVSPLILDLDGDGLVETQSKTEGIYFDHAGDGFAEATGWAGADDGVLVRDLNGDGAINNGTELFGNNTRLKNGQYAANGFEALKDLDSNKDGKLNSADAAWSSLRVWKDTDADAQTDAGELLSLDNAGVREIKLAYTNAGTNPDPLGNEHRQTSTYTTTSGTVRAVHDVWFGTDNWNTVDQRTPIELSSAVAAMPEVIGSGTLGSLRQAMMRDPTGQLITAVNKYLTTSNLAQRDSLLQDVLYRWAGVQDQDRTLRGPYIEDGRKLAVLEAFFGEQYVQLGGGDFGPTINDPGSNSAAALLRLYADVAAKIGAQLDVHGHDAPFYNAIRLNWNESTNSFSIDASGVEAYVRELYLQQPQQTMESLGYFILNLKELGTTEVLNALAVVGNLQGDEIDQLLALAQWDQWGTRNNDQIIGNTTRSSKLFGWDGNDSIEGGSGNDILDGGNGNDYLNGGAGNDSLLGGAGSDSLYGDEGNDTLDGGAGSDYVDGGAGNDTYLFGKGDGQDTIQSDYNTSANKLNVLQFKVGVTPAEVIVTRSIYDDLVLSIAGTTDKITIQHFFYNDNPVNEYNPIQQVSFADGTRWDFATIKTMAITGNNTAQNLTGYNGDDTINALGGNDTVYGLGGNDYIDGGAGYDYLDGGAGHDTLNGGSGLDSLYGGSGNDTYIVDNTGDMVYENINEGTDTVRSSVTYTLSANVENLTLTGIATINGTGNSLNNSLTGNSANNRLTGGTGNDTLNGGAGIDLLYGG